MSLRPCPDSFLLSETDPEPTTAVESPTTALSLTSDSNTPGQKGSPDKCKNQRVCKMKPPKVSWTHPSVFAFSLAVLIADYFREVAIVCFTETIFRILKFFKVRKRGHYEHDKSDLKS